MSSIPPRVLIEELRSNITHLKKQIKANERDIQILMSSPWTIEDIVDWINSFEIPATFREESIVALMRFHEFDLETAKLPVTFATFNERCDRSKKRLEIICPHIRARFSSVYDTFKDRHLCCKICGESLAEY